MASVHFRTADLSPVPCIIPPVTSGIDVYEEEGKHFFHDLSDVVIEDDVLTRLTTFTNVLITPHQGAY